MEEEVEETTRKLGDQVVATIRTAVPAGVGYLIALVGTKLTSLGVDVKPSQISTVSTVIAVGTVSATTAVWYSVIGKLSKKWPKFGWLLGNPRKPNYKKPSGGGDPETPKG